MKIINNRYPYSPKFGYSSIHLMKTMFKTCIILLLLLLALPSTAQDIIILKSGRQIKSSIVEEDQAVVKYREYGDKTGPLYSVEKSLVAEIKYSRETLKKRKPEQVKEVTGNKQKEVAVNENPDLLKVKQRYVYQGERKLSPRNVKTIMENQPDAIRVYEKGYRLCNWSNTCISGITFVSAAATLTANRYEEQSARMKILVPALVLDGAMIVSGIVLASKGKNLIRESVTMYNSRAGKEEPLTFRVNLGVSPNAIGIRVAF